eukprot:m.57418 g.57418  ORF g.57418 m.57418 type:complete len:414 (+) comp6831_c0_seq1:87-1328(+)
MREKSAHSRTEPVAFWWWRFESADRRFEPNAGLELLPVECRGECSSEADWRENIISRRDVLVVSPLLPGASENRRICARLGLLHDGARALFPVLLAAADDVLLDGTTLHALLLCSPESCLLLRRDLRAVCIAVGSQLVQAILVCGDAAGILVECGVIPHARSRVALDAGPADRVLVRRRGRQRLGPRGLGVLQDAHLGRAHGGEFRGLRLVVHQLAVLLLLAALARTDGPRIVGRLDGLGLVAGLSLLLLGTDAELRGLLCQVDCLLLQDMRLALLLQRTLRRRRAGLVVACGVPCLPGRVRPPRRLLQLRGCGLLSPRGSLGLHAQRFGACSLRRCHPGGGNFPPRCYALFILATGGILPLDAGCATLLLALQQSCKPGLFALLARSFALLRVVGNCLLLTAERAKRLLLLA